MCRLLEGRLGAGPIAVWKWLGRRKAARGRPRWNSDASGDGQGDVGGGGQGGQRHGKRRPRERAEVLAEKRHLLLLGRWLLPPA
jgi:hypothetical protein